MGIEEAEAVLGNSVFCLLHWRPHILFKRLNGAGKEESQLVISALLRACPVTSVTFLGFRVPIGNNFSLIALFI